ncbi:hypothetical protein DFQ26_007626 [Actinomortierella ambigua]|nr:hypothetical protein DFQ26_007626 [Actinomortierella ambigua]
MPKVLELSSKEESVANLLKNDGSAGLAINPIPLPGERKTFRVQSNLISRLEAFLPKIRDANAELEKQVQLDPKAVDIENVDEESGEQYIEMDLGLGVYDLRKDVKEEDIIITPTTSSMTAASSSSKPIIQMMETDSAPSSSIPKQGAATTTTHKEEDGDVTMA